MANIFDEIMNLLQSANRGVEAFGGQTPPALNQGFPDYGPWGAGGGKPLAGPYPNAPGQPTGVFPAPPGAENPFNIAPGAAPLNPLTGGPMGAPGAAPSASGPEFNAFFDPSRGGWGGAIGALMGNPTRQEYQLQQQGAARTSGLQKLGAMIQSGADPQRAIVDFINTPEGADFIANSSDPSAEIKAFLGLATPDPTQAVRADAFGGGAPTAGAPAGGGGDAARGLTPGRPMQEYLAIAEKLARAGDTEGAKLAVDMAEEARLGAVPAELDESSIKRYNFYVANEMDHGKTPLSYNDWLITQTKAGVQTPQGGTIPTALVDAAIKASDGADLAEAQYTESQQFRELAETADTSWMASMSLPLQQALQSIGITVNEDLPTAELIQALSNQMALRLRNPESGFGLTGNTSNFDLQFLRAATAGLDKTPESNQAVLIILGSRLRRQATLDRLKADFIFENGTLAGWGEVRQEAIETTPLLTDEERETLSAMRTVNGLPAIDPNGKPIPGTERTPIPTEGEFGPIPETFAPDASSPEVRARAWEIFNQSKRKGKADEADTGDRLKKRMGDE